MAAVATPHCPPRRPGRPTGRKGARARASAAQGEIFFVKQIDNSRLVRVANPQERREFLIWVMMGTVLFAAGLAYAWQRFALVRYGYTIEQLKSRREALIESNRQLRLEEASLRSPERIDAIARANLGLETPRPGQVLSLEDSPPATDGTVVVAQNKSP